MESVSDLLVTVVVCTANRSAKVVTAVTSILADADETVELIVVDQSADSDTATALMGLRSDARMNYLHEGPIGKGAALNVGIAHARAGIIACTDDDCVVTADWWRELTKPFAEFPNVAVVFGCVEAAPHDPILGFVPAYCPGHSGERTSSLRTAPNGMGASMAVRKSAILAIGGFDPAIGPGAPFRSGDDRDIAIRALLAGYSVYETTGAKVLHHGFRSYRDGHEHARRAWFGMGATCAKLLKRGHPEGLLLAVDLCFGRAVVPAVLDVTRFRRPRGIARIASFVHGFARALRTPVRRDTLVFDLGSPQTPRGSSGSPHGDATSTR